MTVWDAYLSRYRQLPVWSPEVDDNQFEDQYQAMEESLIADFSQRCPPSSPEDVRWFQYALADEQRKFFAAFVLQEPRKVPEALYEPMIRASVYEQNPSRNKAFVEPCLATFGLRRVNESLLESFEIRSDPEKAGAVQAMYWAILIRGRDADRHRPEARVWFETVGDLWMRQRCGLLREFVNNPSVVVRQRIVPHLDLRNISSYPEEFQPLVPEAIQIARNHADDYIRHRIEIQMGSNESQLFAPLPSMSRAGAEEVPQSGSSAWMAGASNNLVARLKSLIGRLRRRGSAP